jgi:hypothetical protein
LIGVFVGGVIAGIAPVANLISNHKRWKREVMLEHLKSERKRMEQLFRETYDKLPDAMANNSYPIHMLPEIMISMPKIVSERFHSWMGDKNKDESKAKEALLDISIEMKKSLAFIDDQIRELILK